MKAHVGVAVAVLYAHDEVADDRHARAVAGEFLVGHLRVVLLRLDELVVEIQVVWLHGHKLASILEYLHQQAVQLRGRIEVIALSGVGGIGRINCGQLRNPSQDGVWAACAQSRMKREMGHQVARHVLNAVTATEVDAWQRTRDLAILIAVWSTSETQHFVDDGADVTGKKLSYMKYSSKRSDFLRFYAYLCHVIDDFACL